MAFEKLHTGELLEQAYSNIKQIRKLLKVELNISAYYMSIYIELLESRRKGCTNNRKSR